MINIITQQAFYFLLSNILSRSIPFFLLPILTNYLTPTEYGIVNLFESLIPIVTILIGLSMESAVSVNFFKMEKNLLSVYIWNTILIVIASFLFFTLIAVFFQNKLSTLLHFPSKLIFIVIVVAFCQYFYMLCLALLQMNGKALQYGIFQFLRMALNFGVSLTLIVLFNYGWKGRISGIVIASLVIAGLGFYAIKKKEYIKFDFNRDYIKDALYFAIPLIPNVFSGYFMTSIDKFFISGMVGIRDLGIYAVGYQISMVISLVSNSFNQAFVPYLFKNLSLNQQEVKEKIVKISYAFIIGIILLAIVINYVVHNFIFGIIISRNYSLAVKYVPLLTVAFIFHAAYLMVVNYIFFQKKTFYLSIISLISLFVFISASYILIKANGTIGAAQAMAISFFVRFVSTFFCAQRICSMPWLLLKVSNNTKR